MGRVHGGFFLPLGSGERLKSLFFLYVRNAFLSAIDCTLFPLYFIRHACQLIIKEGLSGAGYRMKEFYSLLLAENSD
jgi:hypothetical protein